MTLEDRVLDLEKLYNGIDQGRFERIEKQNTEIFNRLNKLVENTGRMDERLNNVEKDCEKHSENIEVLHGIKSAQTGGIGVLKFIIPLSIAITGIIVSLITVGIDKLSK